MILNESEIIKRLLSQDEDKRLIVTPLVEPQEQFGPSSLDVRLGTEFQVLKRTSITHLDPLANAETMQPNMALIKVQPGQAFVLHPGEFALASTLEYLRIPLDLACRLEGRSTWGRLGLQVHATAGFVDPGFCGALTFELSNLSTVPIPLYPGARIGQLCFFESQMTQLSYPNKKLSKYSGFYTTASSAIHKDPEYQRLRAANTSTLSLI